MKRITVFNNSLGNVTVKIIRGNNVETKQLENYESTDECIDVDLEVGEMVTIENEGDEFD